MKDVPVRLVLTLYTDTKFEKLNQFHFCNSGVSQYQYAKNNLQNVNFQIS